MSYPTVYKLSENRTKATVASEYARIDQYNPCMYDMYMAQKTSTVNISFREDFLSEIDEVARTESRSRSELVREAARLYIERKKRMKSVIESMREIASERVITAEDVQKEIASYRAEKNAR